MPTRREFLKGATIAPFIRRTSLLPAMPLRTVPIQSMPSTQPLPFVHLHVHSHFSRPGGACGIDELIAKTKQLDMNAIALTDRVNLFGAMEFHRAAARAGIKPIFGLQVYVSPHLRQQRSKGGSVGQAGFPLTLLAKNMVGFRNLIQLSTAQCIQCDHRDRPLPLGKETLKVHSAGLICLSGGAESEINQAISKGHLDKAKLILSWYQKVFGDRFFVEIHGLDATADQQAADALGSMAKEKDVSLVATHPVRYVKPSDYEVPLLLDGICTGRTMPELLRSQQPSCANHLLSPAEMYARFPDQQESLAVTQQIANEINVDLGDCQRCQVSLSQRGEPSVLQIKPSPSIADARFQNVPSSRLSKLAAYQIRGSSAARDRLIASLEHEFGPESVVRGRMLYSLDAPRVLLRSVCHVVGLSCELADKFVEMIPEEFDGTIGDAVQEFAALQEAVMRSSRIARLVYLAQLLDDRHRIPRPCNFKIVVGTCSLSETVPLATHCGQTFTQWNVEDLIGKSSLPVINCCESRGSEAMEVELPEVPRS